MITLQSPKTRKIETGKIPLDKRTLFIYISEHHNQFTWRHTIVTKKELITALAAKDNLTAKQATETINLIFNGFTDALKNGTRIEIRGIGSFTVREYKSYKGRNPRTGKNVNVGPKKLLFFKVGKELKGMVNRSKG